MSLRKLEKPLHHLAISDWFSRLWELRSTAETKQADALSLRLECQQLRNETDIKIGWETFHNNVRIKDRVTELKFWHRLLGNCLNAVGEEISKLENEKTETEEELATIDRHLKTVSDCLTFMDGRYGSDLVIDGACAEFKNEEGVVKVLKASLSNKCRAAWEQLCRLRDIKSQLLKDLENKTDAINIDEDNLSRDKNSKDISYKPDPLRVPKNCVPYKTWAETSRINKLNADQELTASKKLRETLYITRERVHNDIRAQHDATNYALRKRIFDTSQAKNELEWQHLKTKNEMDRTKKEIDDLEEALLNKTNGLKLAETRMENRIFRPGPELVHDEAQIQLGEEVLTLRQIRQDLSEKIAIAKVTFSGLESHLWRIEQDLENKKHALEACNHCYEVRTKPKKEN